MRTTNLKSSIKALALLAGMLLAGTVVAFGQQTVNLTVAPTTTTLPDGTTVPMWGYFCGPVVSGSTANCGPLNQKSAATTTAPATWSPVIITVPTGQALTINLTNNLSFTPAGTGTANTVPTSIMIVGQVGGGLGAGGSYVPSPDHTDAQGCVTWFIASSATPPGTPCTVASPTTMPPNQGPRVQSFGTEVAAGTTVSLTWTAPAPGTYLLESGTHPSIQVPMGLIGMLVVTCPPGSATAACTTAAGVGTAYPGVTTTAAATTVPAVTYSAELPLEFSEIDPVQNKAVTVAVNTPGFNEMNMKTFGDSLGSITITNGGTGYTSNPTVTISSPGTGVGAATASATATVGAVISNISVLTGGVGYTSAPTVNITDTGTPITPASATAVVSFAVASVTINNGGTGYVVGDVIHLTGGGGYGASASVSAVGAGGVITSIAVTQQAGSGYTSAPAVSSITSVAGTGASLTPVLATAGVVSSVTVTNSGSGYHSAAVTFSGGGATTNATASVTTAGTNGVVYSVSFASSGSRYSTPPSVTIAAPGTGTTATAVASLSQSCSQAGTSQATQTFATGCYPSAVNYTPFYYLIDGVAFDKTWANASLFAATAGATTTGPVTTGIPTTGSVLLRLVNAGSRMHVPSTVGSLTTGFNGAGTATQTVSGFTLVAEDGNVIPGVAVAGSTTVPAAPKVQTDVFMAAGKTFDVLINVPAAGLPALPIYDRELSLSGNSSTRDAGMLAYISVNGATIPNAGTTRGTGTGVFAGAHANNDTYNALVAGEVFKVTDASKGVIANDINVYGVALLAAPTNGTLTCEAQAQNTIGGLCGNGTFTYTPNNTTTNSDTFTYCANGTVTGTTCSSGLTATVTLGASNLTGNPSAITQNYTAATSVFIKIPSPGLLLGNTDPSGLPLSVVIPATPPTGVVFDADGGFTASITSGTSLSFPYTVQNSQGRSASGTVNVTFPTPSNLTVNVLDAQAYQNCQGNTTCISNLIANPNGITDYRWIIEEDQTFWVDPNCTTNNGTATPPTGCAGNVGPAGTSTIPTFAVNFHTSAMPFVAQGCTGVLSCEGGQTILDTNPSSATYGQHVPAVCDVGNGACRPDPNCPTLPCGASGGFTHVLPRQVHLDPSKRYYISVLPGDAGNPFPGTLVAPTNCLTGEFSSPGVLNTACGHTMSGAPIPPACNVLVSGCNAANTTALFAPVNVLALPTPLPTGKLSVMVFEDDFPLNGEQDAGGGVDTLSPNEPGLGNFNIVLWDTYGGLGDVTGQNGYDMFNQPLSNALSGTIDPSTGFDACPVSTQATANPGQAGITGMIVTCPKYESDNATLSPLAGQALIANLMPEKFSVQAYPGADRIARGEEWLQTNTLDGQHAHDSFIRIGEPGYFQEYGAAGYHVSIGFANPKIINDRYAAVCAGAFGTVGSCSGSVQGEVDLQRLSRTPDQRLYPSGSRDGFSWTQCWVSLGDPDAEDFMFTKCTADGHFRFNKVPLGNWRITIGDQWNDQIIDGLSLPANLTSAAANLDLGHIGVQQWQSNLYTRLFVDDNKNGIPDAGEIGVPQVYTRIRYRDGHNSNGLLTDPNGIANFNETFPLFNWYVVETDSTRYKRTGTHTVYDAGGPADGSTSCGSTARPCGPGATNNPATWPYAFLANTYEAVPLPADLHVPGAVYCGQADCAAEAAGFAAGTASTTTVTNSTGRIDPPWVAAEGWSGLTSQSNWIEFGVAPYAACPPACATVPNPLFNPSTTAGGTTASTMQVAENGGIHGIVDYASTRPFDMAEQMIEQPWEPYVPGVTMNLYQEGFAADGSTPILKLVDTTKTTSWDAWAQGFYPNSTASGGEKPYMSCPGQGTATSGANQDLFFYTLFDQPNYLNYYSSLHGGPALNTTTLPYNSQFKCYDAMHIWNQIQPAPYDGRYEFPSSLGVNATTGQPLAAHGCVGNVPGTACPTANTATVTVSTLPGTNCTICVPNPDATDHYRVGTPMLPPGKYVVEVIMPPGYEVYKEEDKNLLIGDNYIAPTTQQFAGLGGSIFIIPDQASIASMYDPAPNGYNPNNYQDSTTALGLAPELSGVPGFPGYQNPLWPCVGEMRVVPDYLSLFPQALEVAPFAGATRPLCDRKEVTLQDQMNVRNNFFIYTSTHIASKYTGVITDDFTAEFDPFSPQFGEKFAPPNMPVSTKDYLGNEISRVYSDHFGIYDGLTFSSWEVNPPNITGYSPTMMVQCMNDAGPILDTRANSPTLGQMITDPLFNPGYSQFCYEEPYMPGLTTYLDTPVVPTVAFAGAGYNNVDCAYPDATPAISEVDGDGIGPYVSAINHNVTIYALGNQQVPDAAYSGPSANAAPFNAKTINRHYGFGSAQGTVTIGGRTAHIVSWNDNQIVVNGLVAGQPAVPLCPIQQQLQYGGPSTPTAANAARCGQLVVTTANTAAAGQPSNAKQSIDTVTVTIGGKGPIHVPPSGTIQSFIDQAKPGDLLIVDPTARASCVTTSSTGTVSAAACNAAATGTSSAATVAFSPSAHNELIIMWKPVRLQGVGAASSILNANTHPAGKLLDPWRRHMDCLFGLTVQGVPIDALHAYDPNFNFNCPDNQPNDSWFGFLGTGNSPQIDRLPLEATVGWTASLSGNLAELLQEPTLMGAYEGAGITVLAKGLEFHGQYPWNDGNEAGAFPTQTTLLTGVVSNPGGVPGTAGALQVGDANQFCHTGTYNATTGAFTIGTQTNPYASNFMCNPSSIDGLSVTNSSQGGGGIYVHGWAHFLQIANNRVYNNAGSLSGGISIGQGEFALPYIQGGTTNAAPGSCSDGTNFVTNEHLPYCLQLLVNVHNNMITDNSSLGDELFSATLSGGGGATFCTGNDYYKFNFNWVCGNLSSGEGGGLVHLGEIQHGDIEHNSIVFNQSHNPTIPTNGGGIMVQGTPDTDPTCPGVPDSDCPTGLSDGTGPGLVINANLIQGNGADSGSGGGIRLQQVNGTEVGTFASQPTHWHDVTISNNIIVNNIAGWDGAGISLQDSLNVNIVNNTIMHNDSTASSGVLTQSLGNPQASAPPGSCVQAGNTASCPQSAGVTSTPNSSLLVAAFGTLAVTCPAGHPACSPHVAGGNGTGFSNPILVGDVISQNRSFNVSVGGLGIAPQNQQNVVTMIPTLNQGTTGQCVGGATYWDIGVRGDTGAGNHGSTFTLNPINSILSSGSYPGNGNQTGDPAVVTSYCNGSRVPPECTTAMGCAGPHGFGVPPGIADAVTPNPLFSLVPSATVDEGNNWINLSWGPLSLVCSTSTACPNQSPSGGSTAVGALLGNYSITAGSPAVNGITCNSTSGACTVNNAALPTGYTLPTTDFFNNNRPDTGRAADIGAVEILGH